MPDRFESEPYADPMRWNRHLREDLAEPFYSTEAPCLDCGRPLSECACKEAPDEPVCPGLYPALVAARNVREIHEVCKAHRLDCALCSGVRKMPGRETAGPMPAKRAA